MFERIYSTSFYCILLFQCREVGLNGRRRYIVLVGTYVVRRKVAVVVLLDLRWFVAGFAAIMLCVFSKDVISCNPLESGSGYGKIQSFGLKFWYFRARVHAFASCPLVRGNLISVTSLVLSVRPFVRCVEVLIRSFVIRIVRSFVQFLVWVLLVAVVVAV